MGGSQLSDQQKRLFTKRIMDKLGFKNRTQVKTWMKRYRNGEINQLESIHTMVIDKVGISAFCQLFELARSTFYKNKIISQSSRC